MIIDNRVIVMDNVNYQPKKNESSRQFKYEMKLYVSYHTKELENSVLSTTLPN